MDLPTVQEKIARYAFLAGKRAWQRLALPRGGGPRRCYVLVAGVQRSGTNMLMDVLERSIETDVYHETDPRAFDNYQMREPEVIEALARASRARVFVIKTLCELQSLDQLMRRFSPARAVWIIRHYDDVTNSMARAFPQLTRPIKRMASRRQSAGWPGDGMSDETHDHLRRLVHSEIDLHSACALMWYLRNVLYFERGFDADERILPIHYEDVVTVPAQVFPDLFAFLHVPYSAYAARKVVASSVRRNPPPSIEPGIRDLCESLYVRILARRARHA